MIITSDWFNKLLTYFISVSLSLRTNIRQDFINVKRARLKLANNLFPFLFENRSPGIPGWPTLEEVKEHLVKRTLDVCQANSSPEVPEAGSY